jgi:hypothetical protein
LADKGQKLSGCQASNLNNNNGRPQSSNQNDKNNTNDNNGGPQSSNQDICAQRNNMLLPRQIERWCFRNRAFGNQSSRSKNKQPTLKTTKSNKNLCLWK